MTDPAGPESTAALDDAEYRAGVIDLLGVLGFGELTAFERLAADAGMAPTLSDKAALAGIATEEYGHFVLLRDRLAGLGVAIDDAMAPFVEPLTLFHQRTAPTDWLEGLVKAYIGDGMAHDFYREIAARVDPETRELVLTVLDRGSSSEFIVERVRTGLAEEASRAGRLALWGRRVVGEALSQAQHVATDRDTLAALIVGRAERPGMDLAEIGRVFARLTDNHAHRMEDLGLAS
ncbi:MAG TPA: ferritin-like fold-containing protein [Jiangellaceae bacterium]|nr:ferritin-like fold-containing protein [Jiangellaceae bacterium]